MDSAVSLGHDILSNYGSDNSSAGFPGVNLTPVGDTWRSAGSSWFNQAAIANEDWRRSEQSADNALARDLYYLNQTNTFNAAEAQKQRDFEERMSNTAYQRAMEDMKIAGLNPVLAFQQGGASTPSGSSATSSGARSGSSNSGYKGSDPLSNLVSAVVGGFVRGLTGK